MKFAGALLAAAAVANAAYVAPEYPNVKPEDCQPLYWYDMVKSDKPQCVTFNPSSYGKPSDSYKCDVNEYVPPTTTAAPAPTETCATPIFYHQGDGQYLITPDNYILHAENDQPGCEVKLVKCPTKIDYTAESSRGACWTKVGDYQYRNGHGHCLHWHKNATHSHLTQHPCGKPAYKPQAWSCGKPSSKPKPKPTKPATPVPTATDCPTPTYARAKDRTCADWVAEGNTCGGCYIDSWWNLVSKPGSVKCGCDEECADVCCTASYPATTSHPTYTKPSYDNSYDNSYGNNNNGGSYDNNNNGGSYDNNNNNGGSYDNNNNNNGGSYDNNNNNNGGSYDNNNGGSYDNNNNGGSYGGNSGNNGGDNGAYSSESSPTKTSVYTPTQDPTPESSSPAEPKTTSKSTPTNDPTYKYNSCTEWFKGDNQCDANQNPIAVGDFDKPCGHECGKSDCCVAGA